MTKTDIERIIVLEQKVDSMRTDLCNHIEKADQFELRLESKIDKWMEVADNRFASKLVEKIVYGLVALILSSVIMAILGLIIIQAR